jgi:hypothetical protein
LWNWYYDVRTQVTDAAIAGFTCLERELSVGIGMRQNGLTSTIEGEKIERSSVRNEGKNNCNQPQTQGDPHQGEPRKAILW